MTIDVQPQKIFGPDNSTDINLNLDALRFQGLTLSGALEPSTVRLWMPDQDQAAMPEQQGEAKDSGSEILSKLNELEAKINVLTELLDKKK